MKKKMVIILNMFLICVACLVGCGDSKLSEKDIVESLDDAFRTIYVNDEPSILNVESIEVEKRKTDEDVDTVYCTIVLSNENYKNTKECILYYSFYDKGGWLLDNWETIESYTEITNGVTRELTDDELSRYYFDEYQFVEQVDDVENNISYTTYKVKFLSDNYSYDGNVTLESSFISGMDGGNWEYFLSYDNSFDFNVQGIWAADSENFNGNRSWNSAIEIDIQAVNQDEGYIEVSAIEYRGKVDQSYDVDETGDIEAYIEMVQDEQSQDELKYQEPSFSFEFNFEESKYVVKIDPYEIYARAEGYGGNASGNLYKGYTINVWVNEFGWPQFEKVPE